MTPSPTPVATTATTATVATTASTAPATGTSVPVGVPVPGSPTQQSFQLGSGGTAIVDTANGTLRIVSVTPAPGWIVERAEQDDQTSIEIRLESGSGEVRFEASLVRGVIVVSFRADDDATGTTAVTTPGSGSTSSTVGGDDDNSGPGGGDDDNSGPGGGGDDGDDNSGPGGGGDDGSSGSGSSGSGSSGSGSG